AFNGLVLSAADAAAEDAATACAKLIGSLSIKSGTDYDTFAARLKAKGWHQTLTTTQNISSWTRSGHTISVTLNLGSGTSATTTGAVRCRN
ncbi:hypothetical protein ACF0BG_19420, partial [Acinetobacter baumannii]